ncbi:MAG TPA: hypothetical protein VF131_19885 [Blastocatellia bacterium]|nr:hypothetical protein [Blastocatellia bacterium]
MGKRITLIALILLSSPNLSGCVSSGEPDSSKNSSINTEASDRAVGSDARLFIEGRNSIMLSVDEKAFSDLITALSSDGDGGVERLIESGKVFTVPNNTRVRILEIATAKNKVRIIEGDRIMQEGWVHELWIK